MPCMPSMPKLSTWVSGKAADAQQGGDHRYLGLLGQLLQLVVSPGDDDAAPGDDDRLLGLVDQLGRLLDLRRVPLDGGLVARQVDLRRDSWNSACSSEHVLGDIDEHRAGPARARQVEGLFDDRGQRHRLPAPGSCAW